MIRVLVLSDIHERTRSLPRLARMVRELGGVDLVLLAGDITYFKPVEAAVKILREIRESIGTPVFYVPGNCDDPRLTTDAESAGDIVNIHGRHVVHGDYVFYGVGGGGISPFNTWIEYGENDFKRLLENAKAHDPGRLVMVTHQPIKGFFDEVNGVNIGSEAFREFLYSVQPLLWVTGHVHEHSGWVRAGKTTVIHPGPFMRGYYALVSLSNSVVDTRVERL